MRRSLEVTPRASYRSAAAFGGLGFAVMTALGLVSAVVTARLYGVEVIGEFALVTAPVTAVWYLSTARERPAFVRELATLDPRAPRVTGLFAVVAGFSSALTAVAAAVAVPLVYAVFHGPVHQPQLFAPALVGLAGHLVATNPGWNLDAVLAGFRAGRELFWIRLHQVAAFLAVAVGLSQVLDSVWGLVLATVVSYATSLVHRLVAVRAYMRFAVSRAELRDGLRTLPGLIRFGLKLVPGGVAQGAGNEVGTWTLGIVASVAAVGTYGRAWTLARRLLEINWRVNEMLLPTLVERLSTGDADGFDRAVVDTTRYCVALLLLPAAAAGGAAVSVMALFGDDFAPGANALAILLLVPVAVAVVAVQRTTLLAADRPGLTSIIAIAGALVTTAVTVALTPSLGVTGAALGLLAGSVFEATWVMRAASRFIHASLLRIWPLHELAALPAAYLAGFAAAHAASAAIQGLAGLVPGLVCGSLAFAAVLAAAGGVNARDRARFAAVRDSLRTRTRLGAVPGTRAGSRPERDPQPDRL